MSGSTVDESAKLTVAAERYRSASDNPVAPAFISSVKEIDALVPEAVRYTSPVVAVAEVS